MSTSGWMTAADAAALFEAADAVLLDVLGATPQPTYKLRAIARRHGISWRVLRSTAHGLGVVELRELGKHRLTFWALPRRQDGTPRGPDVGLENLSVVVRVGGS